MITRLNMLILLQHDLDAAIEFYQKLELKLVFQMKGRWAEFALADGTTIGMCPIGKKPEHLMRTGMVFEVDDLHAVHAQLKDTTKFVNEPTEKEHGIIASIADPGNNVIDLYQPTPEKLKELIRQQQEAAAKAGCDACPGGCPADKEHATETSNDATDEPGSDADEPAANS